jgi:large subunit ribosomal protein L25
MADKIVLPATKRTDFGKGAARQARRAGQIPGVIYGHGEAPLHILLPNHETTLAVRNPNALLTLDVEGKNHLVLPKEIQRAAIKRDVEHLDLITVRRGEKVVVDAPVEVIGEPAPGFEYILDQATVSVEAEATDIPESIVVDITDRDENALPEHLSLPAGVALALTDLESPIVSIHEPEVQDLGEDEAEEGSEEGESAEGESGEDQEQSESE